ncbi:MAG: hypothetical protein ACE5JN_01365 [Candidatus Methylomirabilia bacterium]
MSNKAFRRVRGALALERRKRPRVEIKRGVRDELLVVINGQLASLTHAETLAALKATGRPLVRQLCQLLESGNTEARAEAAWLLGQIGSGAAIPSLIRALEGARWRGEAPVILRRTTEALLRLGQAGAHGFDLGVQSLATNDLSRLLLIRHASEQLVASSPPYPVSRQITSGWIRALHTYLGRLQRLDSASKADKLSFQRVVLEAYGLSLETEREKVVTLIESLSGYPALATRKTNRTG